MHRFLSASLIVTLAVGCADSSGTPEGELDGLNDDVGDDKADTGGIRPNTPEAYAVVTFANFASRQELGWARLGNAAANAIVAYRYGDDEIYRTEDDHYFETLEELDAMPYVGPQAFKAMLAFSQKRSAYQRPQIDGEWTMWFETASGYAPLIVTSEFLVSDFGKLTAEVLNGTTRFPVTDSAASARGIGITIPMNLDVGAARVTSVFIVGEIRSEELICGSAYVRFEDGYGVNRKMVAARGTEIEPYGDPLVTHCND